jgi:hypothetical protein
MASLVLHASSAAVVGGFDMLTRNILCLPELLAILFDLLEVRELVCFKQVSERMLYP